MKPLTKLFSLAFACIPFFAATVLMMPPAVLTAQTAAATTAQQAAPPVFKVNSRIVVLDVTVHDKKGNLVTGLGKGDFAVSEDGVPQTIRSFETTEQHRMPVPVASLCWTS